MKKLKYYFIFLLLVLLFPFSLFGCNETSFETTPWINSSQTSQDIKNLRDNARSRMSSLPVYYVTSVTYNFNHTSDNLFQKKTINDVTKTTLNYNFNTETLAKVEFNRTVDGENIYFQNDYYVNEENDKNKYTTITQNVNNTTSTEYIKQSYSTTNNFSNLLSNIIYDISTDETNTVQQKEYDRVKYYKLISTKATENMGLDLINRKFVEDSNLVNNPALFKIRSKDDYVLSFSCEYGFDKNDYLTYFAMNYTIGYYNIAGINENYLNVSVVTKLNSFGRENVEQLQVDDKGMYTACTFVSYLNKNDFEISYRDSLEAIYQATTVQKIGNSYLVKIENYQSSTINDTKFYYIKSNDSSYSVYELDTLNKTYYLVDETIDLLSFDFSYKFNKNSININENEYQFGSAEKYFNVEVIDNQPYSIENNYGQKIYLIGEVKEIQTLLFDIDEYELSI